MTVTYMVAPPPYRMYRQGVVWSVVSQWGAALWGVVGWTPSSR